MLQPRSDTSGIRKQRGWVDGDRKLGSAVHANRVRIASLTERQFGQARWDQLRERGVAEATLNRAIAAGRLYEVHRRVYSVVPPSLMTIEAWHAAAILAGGPGACLCCASAGWWSSLLRDRPGVIEVAVRSDLEPIAGVVWRRLAIREGEREHHRRMPITAPVRIPLDVAARLSLWELKGVLAELEFHHDIGADEVATTLRRGYNGSAKLRRAIAEHIPDLALTASELERLFARFLVDRGLKLPSFNAAVGASTVDAIFRAERVLVELDGIKAHGGERRIARDHRRDLHRRTEGFVVLRYHYSQLVDPAQQRLMEAELDRFGISREPCW